MNNQIDDFLADKEICVSEDADFDPEQARKQGLKQRAFLSEVKQFQTLYTIIMDSAMKGEIEPEELQQILRTKHELANIYEGLILDSSGSIIPFLSILHKDVISNDTVPTSILRLAIKTLIKIFDCVQPQNLDGFNPQSLISALINLQIDDHSNQIDAQELIWINIQQLILRILKIYMTEVEVISQFFFNLLDKRGFKIEQEMGQTVHFSEKVKKNTMKLCKLLFLSENQRSFAFSKICDFINENIKDLNKPIELNEQQQPVMTVKEREIVNVKFIRAITFGLKVIEEILYEFCSIKSKEEISKFFQQNINGIVQVTCLSCEQGESVIKNQAQILFQQLMFHILTLKVPVREQFEILFIKCVLKPVISRIKVLEKAEEKELSDQEAETEEVNIEETKAPEVDLSTDLQFQMGITFLEEVIISMRPEDIGLLFLVYDCQHFSESVITKSFNLLVKYTKDNSQKFERFYQNIFKSFLKINLEKDSQSMITHQRLKYMLDQKSSQKALAKQCNVKPKLFLNKCHETYKFIDEQTPWEIASKILLFSRQLLVEHVTEIIGGKEDRNKVIYDLFLDKQDFSDFDLEKTLRRTMQTFRLAGVESQVVLRVMEGFAFKHFEYDQSKVFIDRDECYEMAYLMIVLQTTMHNPNIKKKLRPIDFINQAKACCPKGYDMLPENYINTMYENIKDEELYSPISRDWYDSNVGEGDITICNTKLCKVQDSAKVDQTQFVNSADLTQKQLYNFNNEIDSICTQDKEILVSGALRQIVSMLSNRYLKHQDQKVDILHDILEVNKKVYNFDFTDKILRAIYRIDQRNEPLIKQIISNFNEGSKNTVTLIPQIIFSKVNSFGVIDKNELLEICQASERFFRKNLSENQVKLQREILQLEGKTPSQIDEAIKQQMQFGSVHKQANEQSDGEQGYSLVSIMYNYFNDQNDNIEYGENAERINELKKQQDKLKSEQTNNMKFMNQMFATFINENSPEKMQVDSLDTFIKTEIESLLAKILSVLKENLTTITLQRDGLYCMLFIRNAIKFLVDAKDEATLDMVWQEMHLITSKLTQTQRKVTYLRKSSSKSNLNDSSSKLDESMNSSFDDSDNLSCLDSSRSEDLGSSSGGSAVTPLSQSSDGSKVVISYGSKSKSEQRVYSSLCRHLILQVFFEINNHQIESMVPPASDTSEGDASNDTTAIKKDIQECMREIQRVFKSIVKGSPEDGLQIFDDLHVIICLNKLLSCEQTLVQEDKNGNLVKNERFLPIINYNKLQKLLRNLIIFSTEAIESIQIEVYVQNSDSFIEIINNCLKYIGTSAKSAQKLVSYDLITLVLDLISKITKKSKDMRFEVDIPQFLNIFSQIFEILQVQNQYTLWLAAMQQFQQTVLLNSNLIMAVNWDQTAKHVFLTYRNSVMSNDVSIYGQNQLRAQNVTEMFESLYFSLKFESLCAAMGLKEGQPQKAMKLYKVCGMFIEQITDVTIFVLSQIFTQPSEDPDLFQRLWFSYLKTIFNYAEKNQELDKLIKEDLKRALESQIDGMDKQTQTKTWEVVKSFYPDLQQSFNN